VSGRDREVNPEDDGRDDVSESVSHRPAWECVSPSASCVSRRCADDARRSVEDDAGRNLPVVSVCGRDATAVDGRIADMATAVDGRLARRWTVLAAEKALAPDSGRHLPPLSAACRAALVFEAHTLLSNTNSNRVRLCTTTKLLPVDSSLRTTALQKCAVVPRRARS